MRGQRRATTKGQVMGMVTKAALLVVVAAFLVMIGALGSQALRQHDPSCPYEDSCSAQYYDHSWHIVAG
jgi:hypothetical protein